jgi:hypothetical protein
VKSKQMNYLPALALLTAAALGGCAAPAVKKDDAAVVRERAVERWNLLIAHKAEQAYDYLSPGYRATQTRDEYAKSKNSSQIHWQSVAPVDEKCEAETCVVHVIVTSNITLPQLQGHEVKSESPLTEQWLKTNGQWFFLPPDVQKAVQKLP